MVAGEQRGAAASLGGDSGPGGLQDETGRSEGNGIGGMGVLEVLGGEGALPRNFAGEIPGDAAKAAPSVCPVWAEKAQEDFNAVP